MLVACAASNFFFLLFWCYQNYCNLREGVFGSLYASRIAHIHTFLCQLFIIRSSHCCFWLSLNIIPMLWNSHSLDAKLLNSKPLQNVLSWWTHRPLHSGRLMASIITTASDICCVHGACGGYTKAKLTVKEINRQCNTRTYFIFRFILRFQCTN